MEVDSHDDSREHSHGTQGGGQEPGAGGDSDNLNVPSGCDRQEEYADGSVYVVSLLRPM